MFAHLSGAPLVLVSLRWRSSSGDHRRPYVSSIIRVWCAASHMPRPPPREPHCNRHTPVQPRRESLSALPRRRRPRLRWLSLRPKPSSTYRFGREQWRGNEYDARRACREALRDKALNKTTTCSSSPPCVRTACFVPTTEESRFGVAWLCSTCTQNFAFCLCHEVGAAMEVFGYKVVASSEKRGFRTYLYFLDEIMAQADIVR